MQCPKSLVDEGTDLLLLWWDDWKTFGLLPWPGGLLEQPAWFVEALRIIEKGMAMVEARESMRMRRQLDDLVQLGRRRADG